MKSPNGYDWCSKCGRLTRIFYTSKGMQYTCRDGCNEKDVEKHQKYLRSKAFRERRQRELIVSDGTGI